MDATVIVRVLIGLVNAFSWILIVYCVLSWIPSQARFATDARRAIGKVVDPVLDLFRRIVPPIGGMVDISPILALLVLQFIVRLIIRLLY